MSNVDDDDVRRLLEQGRNFHEIADLLGSSPSTVNRTARRLGLRSSYYVNDRMQRFPRLHDAEWLRGRFDRGSAIAEVADEIGVSYGAVVTARQRFGLSRPRARLGAIDVDEVLRRLETGELLSSIGRATDHSSSGLSRAGRRSATPA